MVIHKLKLLYIPDMVNLLKSSRTFFSIFHTALRIDILYFQILDEILSQILITYSLHTHSISPSLPPSTLLLRALAAPINPADINQIQGVYPSRPSFTPLLGTPEPSAVAGNEGCFEIVSVGPNTPPSLSKGSWVIMKNTNFGTFRTHALAEASQVLKIENKEGLTPVQVGTVGVNPVTAYRMIRDFANLEEGDWIIQNGANSGVGRAVIQLANIWNFKTINVIRDRETEDATNEMKQELLDLGATKVITESELMSKGFKDRLAELTGSRHYSIRLGLNCVGGKATTALAKNLGPGGHLVTYGAMAKKPLEVPNALLIFKDLKFSGFWVSRWSEANEEEKGKTVTEILDWTREGRFKDTKVQVCKWDWGTDEEVLKGVVQGTLGGFRGGKGVFVFGDT